MLILLHPYQLWIPSLKIIPTSRQDGVIKNRIYLPTQTTKTPDKTNETMTFRTLAIRQRRRALLERWALWLSGGSVWVAAQRGGAQVVLRSLPELRKRSWVSGEAKEDRVQKAEYQRGKNYTERKLQRSVHGPLISWVEYGSAQTCEERQTRERTPLREWKNPCSYQTLAWQWGPFPTATMAHLVFGELPARVLKRALNQ